MMRRTIYSNLHDINYEVNYSSESDMANIHSMLKMNLKDIIQTIMI